MAKKRKNKPKTAEYDGSEPLKSCMQEMFVQNLLKGLNQQTAYREAYPRQKSKDEVISTKASELVRKPNVKARLDHCRAIVLAKTTEEVVITREGQLRKYEEHRAKALELGQVAAANGAASHQDSLAGLVDDKGGSDLGKMGLAALLMLAGSKGLKPEMPVIEGETVSKEEI